VDLGDFIRENVGFIRGKWYFNRDLGVLIGKWGF
jgi:hypothetical protein